MRTRVRVYLHRVYMYNVNKTKYVLFYLYKLYS